MADPKDQMLLSIPEDLKKRFKERYPPPITSKTVRDAMIAILDGKFDPSAPKPEKSAAEAAERISQSGLVDIVPDFRKHDFTDDLTNSETIHVLLENLLTFITSYSHSEALQYRFHMGLRTRIYLLREGDPSGDSLPQLSLDNSLALNRLFTSFEEYHSYYAERVASAQGWFGKWLFRICDYAVPRSEFPISFCLVSEDFGFISAPAVQHPTNALLKYRLLDSNDRQKWNMFWQMNALEVSVRRGKDLLREWFEKERPSVEGDGIENPEEE